MTMPTLATICDAIAEALSSATGLKRTFSYDEIKEGIPETPLLEVYPESGEPDGQSYGKYYAEQIVIHADLYARPRSNMGEDLSVMVTKTDAILTLLRQAAPQAAGTVFGVASITGFSWSWKRQIFEVSQNKYLGARFIFTLQVKG
jgi:hypothetical protein